VQQNIPFSDTAIIEAFSSGSEYSEVRLSPESYIVLKKIPGLVKPRPPATSAEEYQLIFWDKQVTVGIINWNSELNVPRLILRLQTGKYKACSMSQFKESLIKRSDSFREWLLWNLF
jgi:hypothetical protein